MSAETFEELQIQVARAACPQCREKRLEMHLRCDLGQDRCLSVIRCAGCRSLFELASGTEAIARERPHIERLLISLACTRCGREAMELGFRCDVGSKECSYRIVCRACEGSA